MSVLQYLINYDIIFFNIIIMIFCYHVRIKHMIRLMLIMSISYHVSIEFHIISCLCPIPTIKQGLV